MAKKKQSLSEKFGEVDAPMIVFFGFALGILIVGIILSTIGALMEAESGRIWSWSTLGAGLLLIAISLIMDCVAAVYWWLVPRKYGVIKPQLSGFVLIFAVMAFFSAAMISIMYIFRH